MTIDRLETGPAGDRIFYVLQRPATARTGRVSAFP